MRVTKILTLATAALVMSASAASAVPTSTPDIMPSVSSVMLPSSFVITAVQDPQPPKAEIKVDIDNDRDAVWYTDPVWLAVGAIAALVIIVLAVMAARGGGRDSTTVVR